MKVVIIGSGTQAELTHYYFTNDSAYEVVAFCVEEGYMSAENPSLFQLPIVSFTDLLLFYPPTEYKLYIAIGNNRKRRDIFNHTKRLGYSFASYICSKANVWNDLQYGENVFIDQCTCIHPFVKVGDNTILIGASIGHHSVIGSHVLISGAIIGGGVNIAALSFLGLHSSVAEKVRIGEKNIIGAGCHIGSDTDDDSVYSGFSRAKRQLNSDQITTFSGRLVNRHI